MRVCRDHNDHLPRHRHSPLVARCTSSLPTRRPARSQRSAQLFITADTTSSSRGPPAAHTLFRPSPSPPPLSSPASAGRPTGVSHFRRLASSRACACCSVVPSGFNPSFACTHTPTLSSVLLRSDVRWTFTRIYTLPWIRSSRRGYACVLSACVCTHIRI
ncbi:hypothetical protein B0H14DRAFT_2951935, partial [Mycena olivaceomarginata]